MPGWGHSITKHDSESYCDVINITAALWEPGPVAPTPLNFKLGWSNTKHPALSIILYFMKRSLHPFAGPPELHCPISKYAWTVTFYPFTQKRTKKILLCLLVFISRSSASSTSQMLPVVKQSFSWLALARPFLKRSGVVQKHHSRSIWVRQGVMINMMIKQTMNMTMMRDKLLSGLQCNC